MLGELSLDLRIDLTINVNQNSLFQTFNVPYSEGTIVSSLWKEHTKHRLHATLWS